MSVQTVEKTKTEDAVKRNFKNFRANPDIENFYRFIHENDLRREAKAIFDAFFTYLKPEKRKGRKSKKNLQ